MTHQLPNHIVIPGRPDVSVSTDLPIKDMRAAKENMAEFIRKVEAGELPAHASEDPLDAAINALFGQMYGGA